MKRSLLFILVLFALSSCNSGGGEKEAGEIIEHVDSVATKEPLSFFPVTSFIKGEIAGIQTGGINPRKVTTVKDIVDSSWLKMESLQVEMADFLSPVIDSTNLVSNFREQKFFDQTNNTITLTYDPAEAADQMQLRHWDVYIDPGTGRVKRIYLLKELPGKKTQQLTWIAGTSCSIVTISDDINGKPFVEKRVDIKWIF